MDLVSPSVRWLQALPRVHTIMDPTDITGAIIGRATIGHIMDRLTTAGGPRPITAGLMPITEARTDIGAIDTGIIDIGITDIGITDTGATGTIAGDPTLEMPEHRSRIEIPLRTLFPACRASLTRADLRCSHAAVRPVLCSFVREPTRSRRSVPAGVWLDAP